MASKDEDSTGSPAATAKTSGAKKSTKKDGSKKAASKKASAKKSASKNGTKKTTARKPPATEGAKRAASQRKKAHTGASPMLTLVDTGDAEGLPPELSIVIPVYNEEAILEKALRGLIADVRSLGRSFEVIVATNGCVDMTIPIAQELQRGEFPEIVVLECPTANYGAALKLGIESARGSIILCDEIDLCDVDFYRRALRRLDHDECEMVVGSKAMAGSRDRRPFSRRAATKVINRLLWVSTGFQGTDTHGLKAFHRAALMPVVERCVVDKDLFASELVIRAGREGLRVQEIPIELEELRSPPIQLLSRVPRVFKDLGKLAWAIRVQK